MAKRVCRDCPIPNCGAKYLVRLANHLADVHLLDIDERRKYLQEAKLQPKVKCVVYNRENTFQQHDMADNFIPQQDVVHELSEPRTNKTIKINKEKSKPKAVKRKNGRGKPVENNISANWMNY